MELGIIAKSDIKKFIELLRKDRRVYAPINRKGRILFAEVSSADDVQLEYGNTDLSPKGLFFPQCETICTFKGDELLNAPQATETRVVFGMRPCDALALSHLDRIFSQGNLNDPYWLARRENAVIISIACSDPLDSCFCTSVGGGPCQTTGSDVMAYPLDTTLLFEALTEKGRLLLKAASSLLIKPKGPQDKTKKDFESAAKKKVPPLNLDNLKENLRNSFHSPLWGTITEKCLGCGVCAYLCPTCHCFDVTDQIAGEGGRRIRSWDSCQYSLFTLHASGHNPRPSKKERMRQRILHKFLYAPDNYSETFCVGCGRCVRSCPVNLDIRENVVHFSTLNGTGA